MRAMLSCFGALGLLVGCATSPPPPLAAPAPTYSATTVASADLPLDSALMTMPTAALAAPAPAAAVPAAFAEDNSREGDGYLTAKGGLFYPDESDIDPGYILNLAYGRYFTRLVSLELEGGYIVPDPDVSDSDLFVVPLMVNGRVNLPLWILEVYGGVGVGAVYYDFEVGSFDEDGWLLAGNVHVGADLALFDTLTGGLELKYYVTEDTDDPTDASLGGLAAMLTLGLRF